MTNDGDSCSYWKCQTLKYRKPVHEDEDGIKLEPINIIFLPNLFLIENWVFNIPQSFYVM